jgi:DNA repair protein RadC
VDDKRWGAILFLNKRNALIADEVQGSGTVDHAPVIHARWSSARSLIASPRPFW